MLGEVEALILLCSFPHLGSVRIRALIDSFGSPAAVLKASKAEILQLPDFTARLLERWDEWKNKKDWKQELEIAQQYHAEIIPYTSAKYPKRLLELPDHPILLYVKGNLTAADQRSIAIIGTRQASIYGKEMAIQFAQDLAAAGFTIVSGLARGIDTAAHQGALRKGRTIAVIGSGLADIYPQENHPLACSIAEQGALISEFPMKTPPDRQNFPQRNRIVSGMTQATLLIEAPVKSGAMLTMQKAIAQKRQLFALPGRVDMENFKGNHLLIKEGHAQLVENAEDILNCYDDLFACQGPAEAISRPSIWSDEEKHFLAVLPSHEISFEEMMQLSGLPAMKVNVLTTGLLLKKGIKEFPGKIYRKIK